jgi:hypothetical protein
MVCMLLAMMGRRLCRLRLVRLGLYAGVVLAAQYALVLAIALGGEAWLTCLIYLATGVGSTLLVYAVRKAIENVGRRFVKVILIIVAVLVALATATLLTSPNLRSIPLLPILGSLFVGPALALPAYLYMSIRAWRLADPQAKRPTMMAFLPPLAWLAAMAVAWRTALHETIRAYSALPPTRPTGCYICTAAANGHRRLVGSRPLWLRGGSRMLVNDQLCNLKLAELALAAILPRFHRLSRRVYNHYGPILAAKISHPLLADLAYLSLKPFEWLAIAALRLLMKNPTDTARTLYR